MKIAGIIAEYNPFHNGHLYQIEKTRELGATHIVAVMSGDFVQRGDAAIFDKWTRAKAALLNKVDLVVELPVEFSLSSANIFSSASICILNNLGVDMISFGSESGDIKKLKEVSRMCGEIKNNEIMKSELKKGISYPTAQANTIAKLFGKDYSDIISCPNNLLAIEYLSAIQNQNPAITPVTITREQSSHDSDDRGDTIASASFIRSELNSHSLETYTPKTACELYFNQIEQSHSPINREILDKILLYKLRTMSKDDILNLPDVSEGLENRIFDSIKTSNTIEEFYQNVKTKRYTMSRIRRIAFCALVGITKHHQNKQPSFIRVLGSNQFGMEILKKAKNTSAIAISPKFADLNNMNCKDINLTINATNIYSLLSTNTRQCGRDFKENCIILK